jgi:hypothetical protein
LFEDVNTSNFYLKNRKNPQNVCQLNQFIRAYQEPNRGSLLKTVFFLKNQATTSFSLLTAKKRQELVNVS